MCLDALHDRGLTRINIGIAGCVYSTWRKLPVGRTVVATRLLKVSPDFLSKKTKKQIKKPSSNLQIPPKLTPKCCIILH